MRTRSKRGEIKFWETDPLGLLTKSLVATRLRILFRTVKLKSFQRWSRRGSQAKQQLQARARRQKRRQRASKGDRGETTQAWQTRRRWEIWAGTDWLRRGNRDNQRYLKAKTVWGRERAAKPWAEERTGIGQQVRMTYVYVRLSIFEAQTEAKHSHDFHLWEYGG